MRPWFGLHLPNYTFADTPTEALFDRVVEQARAAEDAGFSLVTVMDHLYQIDGVGAVTDPMLEAWSALAALARETRRVRLGTLVTGVTYRNPALLAKTATTLDVIERCPCDDGCPSCVQSPKCGNGNDPLDKAAALRVLRTLLDEDRRPDTPF